MSTPEPVMAEQGSTDAANGAGSMDQASLTTPAYPVEAVTALRSEGIAAEKADKWEDAAECFSRALEKRYEPVMDNEGFDAAISSKLARWPGRRSESILRTFWVSSPYCRVVNLNVACF